MSKNRKNLIIIIGFIFCAVVFCPKFVFAAASVSVSGTTPWAIGLVKGSSVTTIDNTWTVTNDNSGGTETVTIGVTSDGAWTPGATSAANQFVLKLGGTPTYSSGSGSAVDTVITSGTTLVTDLLDNGTAVFGLSFTAPSSGDGAHTLTVTFIATNWVKDFVCGDSITIAHTTTAGVAPIDKTVTYGTVSTALTGATKCWITQNLGATNQATAATDATEPSAGWYWQFNRIQGYYQPNANDALISTATPSTWDTTQDNTYTNWDPAKDPCTLLLGTGWRLPTYTEYFNADDTGAWANYTNTYASVLKLHAAGYLLNSTGTLYSRGSYGSYWSSTQSSSTYGYNLYFSSSSSSMLSSNKAYGFSVRCLKD